MNLDTNAFIAAPDLIEALEMRSTPICCDTDRILFAQGDLPQGLYILDKGDTTLTMTTPDGEPIVSVEAHAGSLLGLPGLIGNEPYSLGATARSGAQLSYIPRAEFTSLMQTEPLLALKILQVLAAEVRSARYALSNR